MPGRYWIPVAVLALAVVQLCTAQEQAATSLRRDRAPRISTVQESSTSALTPTPEMWFYEQERNRYDDPKMAVRKRAEQRAQQRQDRLASQKWYGISNSRPTVSPTPWFGSYGVFWGSNSYEPQRWRPVAAPLVVARPTVER